MGFRLCAARGRMGCATISARVLFLLTVGFTIMQFLVSHRRVLYVEGAYIPSPRGKCAASCCPLGL